MMGTRFRLGCGLFSEFSAASRNGYCLSVVKCKKTNFLEIRNESSLRTITPILTPARNVSSNCAFSSCLTPRSSLSTPTTRPRLENLSSQRRFSDSSPVFAGKVRETIDVLSDERHSEEILPTSDDHVHDNNNDYNNNVLVNRNETLFDKEFRQLDDLKEELDGRKSVDVAGKKRPRRRVKPNLQPSFNFASYVNDSPLLTELVSLGVNLTKWEKGQIPDEVIQLDLKRDLAPIVRHLRKLGIDDDKVIGKILTQNPYILINGLSQFKEQTDYFQKKKFTTEQLTVIMKGAPQLFSRRVESIDARLGFFQQSYSLTGDQLRETIAQHPELFRMKLDWVKKVNFFMNKTLMFKPNEIRELFITVPSIFTLKPDTLDRRFNQLHNVMMIPHQSLVKFPHLLTIPLIIVKQRHKFLKTIDKAVYDPLEAGYTSLTAFTGEFSDERFATEIARVDYETYRDFLKTL